MNLIKVVARASSLACALLFLLGQPVVAADRLVAADWTLAAGDGSSIRLSDVAPQQTTVLFFWATWCPYCKALMPHLQSMRLEYGDDVRILAIDIFDDGDAVKLMDDAGYDFTLLLNGDDVANAYGITGTPGVLIIDGHRNIVFDLRHVPRLAMADTAERASHQQKAASLAPYWAAEIRKAIDSARLTARDLGASSAKLPDSRQR